jgi:NDP-sugar pyrophosphorylase family protein
VGSLDELRAGTFDALAGSLRLEMAGREIAEGVRVGEGTDLARAEQVEPPVWVGRNCEVGDGARLVGPLVVGDNSRVGPGASLRDSIVLPGTDVEDRAIVIGAILGHAGVVEGMRPYGE